MVKDIFSLFPKCIAMRYRAFLIYLMDYRIYSKGQEHNCAICLNEMEMSRVSACGHEFHTHCLK